MHNKFLHIFLWDSILIIFKLYFYVVFVLIAFSNSFFTVRFCCRAVLIFLLLYTWLELYLYIPIVFIAVLDLDNCLGVIFYFIFNCIFECVPICIMIYFPLVFWVYFAVICCFLYVYYEYIVVWFVFTFYFVFFVINITSLSFAKISLQYVLEAYTIGILFENTIDLSFFTNVLVWILANWKGVSGAKYSVTKMDFKTKMRTNLYLQNKIQLIFFIYQQYQDQVYEIYDIFSLHPCVR